MDGDRNSGDGNSGNWNSGNRNSGNRNSGDGNSGNSNSGYWNSGYWNSGDWNSGNWNSGNRNSGDWNSGNWNSGDWNSGDWNSGYWNSGDWNSGYFCEDTPSPTFFDQPTDLSWDEAAELVPWIDLPVGCEWVPESQMTDPEKEAHPNFATIGGFLRVHELDFKEAFKVAWSKLDEETKQRFLLLPNFDAGKFFRITGVDVGVREETKLIVLDGITYKLVPLEPHGSGPL